MFNSKLSKKIGWMMKGSIPLVYFKWFSFSVLVFCLFNFTFVGVPESITTFCVTTAFMSGYLAMLSTLMCIYIRQDNNLNKSNKSKK